MAKTKAANRKKGGMKGRDYCSVDDLSTQEIVRILTLAASMKKNPKKYRKVLDGKFFALIFEKMSLRTRTSFTVGVAQLGGGSLTLTPADINLGKRESVYDVAKNLERMVNGIMIRTFGHDITLGLARHASIPVINGLDELEHPCQAMADFLTIIESGKKLKRAKLSYIGDGNNVAHSLMLMSAKLGATFFVGTPDGYRPSPDVLARSQEIARATGGQVVWTADPVEAARDADMIYTDTWTSMGQEGEAEVRRRDFAPYQVNRALFSNAKSDAIFMHCLPAHRGEEVTDDIIDSPNSVVFQEAENRLHAQKAIMAVLLNG